MNLVGRRSEIGSVAFWAGLVALSLAHNLDLLETQAREVALARARMLFSVVETTRLWNAGHGGVYAPAGKDTPPNPYLDDSERDVVINGREYTKVNPAYMTRQISELVESQNGAAFRLTSLNPIRPGNAPDPWEAEALKRFEHGDAAEVLEHGVYRDRPAFRYMALLRVKEPCLACHAKQGYRVGDIRGGISVSIPAADVLGEIAPQRRQTIVMHLAGFLLLSGASLVFFGRLRASWAALAEAKAAQERMVAERTAELSAANAELARSNAELENFAYIASHDLQEPLRMMGSYAQLIGRRYGDRLDGDGREFLGYMSEGAGRMKAMIDDLLAYSRVDRGEPSFARVETRLAVDAALANLAAALSESGAKVELPADLPAVMGEMPLLVRLFQNLIGNAVKYRRADAAPVVQVRADRDGAFATFAIEDNGIGIPEDARERVFLIFQRLHNRAAYPGTGIGLAIAKKIVERHGGRIWVEAAPGGGSVFRFTLRVAKDGDVSASEQGGGV
ncbi:MAG TPA: ATP-binding protein [Candidatus Omnitrophota bacterium]|nr:ATP-binding protein [Candidatus Omnitrophota bacterium]